MKILFIITQSEMGGAQRYLLELAPYLASKGHETIIVAGEGNDELFRQLSIKYQVLGIKHPIYKIRGLVRRLNPIKDLMALITILKIIRNEKPTALFLQSTKAGFLGSLAAKFYSLQTTNYKLPVVYRIGGWSFNDPRSAWMNKILFWMEKTSARWKDKIIVNSEYDRKIATEKKIAIEKKIVKIYNGIDADQIKFLSKEEARQKITNSQLPHFAHPSLEASEWHSKTSRDRQIPNKSQAQNSKPAIIVGTIANLYATKGIEYLIEAVRILNLQLTTYNLQLVVIGEGRERKKLQLLIKKYELKNFFLVGRMADAREHLRAFDVFVLSSVKEGFPWIILEAMAAELPIIATNVGAIPEIIENKKEGILIPPKDSDALAKAIKFLVENPDKAQALAKSGRAKLDQFSLQKILHESLGVIASEAESDSAKRSNPGV